MTPCSIAAHLSGVGLKFSQVYGSALSPAARLLRPLRDIAYVVPFVAKSESRLPESELMMGSSWPGMLIFA